MLFLDQLSAVRMAKGLTQKQLALLVGFDLQRVRDFETGRRRAEPWLDEAILLSRALCTTGVLPLITAYSLHECDLGMHLPNDIDMLKSGVRLPLSLACRISLRLGLDDPALLSRDALPLQLWSIMSRNERGAEPGCCPWCLADASAGAAHLPTCLPEALWGARSPVLHPIVGAVPRPNRMGAQNGSAIGHGLKAIREDARLTQKQLAERAKTGPVYISRIERGESPLTLSKAHVLAAILRCSTEDLYLRPEERDSPFAPQPAPSGLV